MTYRGLTIISSLSLGCLLAFTACDKGGDEKADKSASEDKDKDGGDKDGDKDGGEKDGDKAGGEKDGDKAGGEKAGGEGDDVAALKAEIEAANEALKAAEEENKELTKELDAAIEAEEELAHEKELAENEKGPLTIAKASGSKETGMWGASKDRNMLKISADVTVNEKKKDGGLYAKASCVVGDEVFVDVMTVSGSYSDLGEMENGDTKRLETTMFMRTGLKDAPSRCQISWDYGAPTFSVRLGESCWDGSAMTDGACAEAIAPAKKGDGDVVAFDFDVKVESAPFAKDDPDAKSVHTFYNGRFNTHLERAPSMHLKTACKVGEKTWVEISPDFPHVSPFSLENGEAIAFGHSQFFLDPLPGEPEWCQLDLTMSKSFMDKPSTVSTNCWNPSGGVGDGSCRDSGEVPAAEAPTADHLTLDQISYHWVPDYRDDSTVVLNARVAITTKKVFEQFYRLTAKTDCDGTEDKAHHIGPDLAALIPGESAMVSVSAFWQEPIKPNPKKCEMTISAEKFGADPVEIGKICITGDKAKAGKCGKKAKGGKVEDRKRYTVDL